MNRSMIRPHHRLSPRGRGHTLSSRSRAGWRAALGGAALAALLSVAHAQQAPGDPSNGGLSAPPRPAAQRELTAVESAFVRTDANSDGRLSKAESAKLPEVQAQFGQIDANADGFISLQELNAAVQPAPTTAR